MNVQASIKPAGSGWSLLPRAPEPLAGALRACRTHFTGAAVFSALMNILYLTPTLYMLNVYDRVMLSGSETTLVWLTLVAAMALGTLAALDAVRQRMLVRAGLRLDRLLSAKILGSLVARVRAGSNPTLMKQAMRDFDTFRQALGGAATLAIFDAPWTPIYILVAFLLHPLLGVLTILGAGILLALTILNQRATKTRLQAASQANAVAYISQEAVNQNAETVRALGMRRALVARQEAERRVGLDLSAEAQFLGGKYASWTKFLRLFLQSCALGAGAWMAIHHWISAGSIIAASVLMTRALQPIEQVVASWSLLMQARTSFDNLCKLFNETETDEVIRTRLPAPAGRLMVERVVTRMPGSTTEAMLKNISFNLEPGELLGVIGPSGAGKTTLARVISGAISPDLGAVRIDGANMADWDADTLARYIGYLPQDSGLLAGTIKENICRFANWVGADPEEVDRLAIEAAQAAGIHEMILRLPFGYDTRLGMNGAGLSSGQAQRVALARALYASPTLLVFDEPNSHLDAIGEQALIRCLSDLKARGAAIIVVAHRAGILNIADKLLLLRDGAVDQFGAREAVTAYLSANENAGRIAGPNTKSSESKPHVVNRS